jgi:hypothetical protein
MQINTIPVYFVGGALVFNIVMEGQLHGNSREFQGHIT